MKLYCVSRFREGLNVLDSNYSFPAMLYLGADRAEAVRIANSVAPPTMELPVARFPELLCALPTTVERTIIRYHNRGPIWASVAEFHIQGED